MRAGLVVLAGLAGGCHHHRPEPAITLHADLTNAEITLDQLQWRKPAGRDASVAAEIVGGQGRDTELQNFKVVSDDIAAEGRIVVGSDNKLKQFDFPSLNLNVVSRLAVDGQRGNEAAWAINIKGSNFDGRNFFRSLFNVGNGPDRASLAAQTHRLGLDDAVIFAGAVNQDRILDYYSQADAFVLPSFAEGLPVVLMEAMAMAVPCVTTQITGVPELIENGVNGCLVAASDIAGLAQAVAWLIDHPEDSRRISLAGRAKVLADYNLADSVARLAEVFARRLAAPANTIG